MGWDVTLLGNLILNGPQNGLYKPKPDYVPSSASGSRTALARVQAAARRPSGWIDRRSALASDLPTTTGHRVRARAELGT